MKKLTALLLAVMLAGCTEVPENIRSGENNPEARREGQEILMDFGNLKIACEPDTGTAQSYYILTTADIAGAVSSDADAEKLCRVMKSVYGIDTDASRAVKDAYGSAGETELSGENYSLAINSGGGFRFGVRLFDPPAGYNDSGDPSYKFTRYPPGSLPEDSFVMLDGSTRTASYAVTSAEDCISKLTEAGLFAEDEQLRLSGFYVSDTGGRGAQFFLTYDQMRFGLPLDSSGFASYKTDGSDKTAPAMRCGCLTFIFSGQDKPDLIRDQSDPVFGKKKELPGIMSFSDASRLLSEVLAENMDVTVREAQLRYCCCYIGDDTVFVYRPMWTYLLKEQGRFGIETLRTAVTAYVDAVDGTVYYSDFEAREFEISRSGDLHKLGIELKETPPAEQNDTLRLTVTAKAYKDGMLTFEHEGREYTAPLGVYDFVNDRGYGSYELTASEKIINNRLGETVSAMIEIRSDMSRVLSCDAVSTNGDYYNGLRDDDGARLVYSLERTEGSLCVISGGEESFTADLNDLPMDEKLDLPRKIPNIGSFETFRFSDGKDILISLSVDNTGDWSHEHRNRLTGFFAEVRSVSDGRAELLLNDGVTSCTVPVYFNDGEVKPGMQVIAFLDETPSLYGSAEHREYDYAVIYTDSLEYKLSGRSFEKDAYAVIDSTSGRMRFVSKVKPGALSE